MATLKKPLSTRHALGFRPTGWTHSGTKCLELTQPTTKGRITVYGWFLAARAAPGGRKLWLTARLAVAGVPYSEHSSFTELRRFVQAFKPKRIVPTVNVGSAKSRGAMQSYFRQWQGTGTNSSARRAEGPQHM